MAVRNRTKRLLMIRRDARPSMPVIGSFCGVHRKRLRLRNCVTNPTRDCVGSASTSSNHEPEDAVRRVRSDLRVKHVESLGWPRPKTSRRLRVGSRGEQPITGERFIRKRVIATTRLMRSIWRATQNSPPPGCDVRFCPALDPRLPSRLVTSCPTVG
jgi:hypothetical protein